MPGSDEDLLAGIVSIGDAARKVERQLDLRHRLLHAQQRHLRHQARILGRAAKIWSAAAAICFFFAGFFAGLGDGAPAVIAALLTLGCLSTALYTSQRSAWLDRDADRIFR